MLTIYIENKPYQVKENQNLLQACLSLGFDLPYFCWHPAMHSVGACRQCAVKQFKDDKDKRGRIVMSCMTPLAEGMRISIEDSEAKAFRASVVEWLMVNHPHDCPVCDEGGECHLQDMTVMTGHIYRRTRFKKRTHRNQDLGPFVNHEMNRCIACYRCVRFYRNYAGGNDLDVFASHDSVYFGRHEDGVLESEFSGNLVEVCPTGVFTDKTFKKQYTRKWDLQTAPSICIHCGLGCNTIAGERYGTLRRILNRYNHELNGYFLCDRGRFGYEFVNSDKRIRSASISPPSPFRGKGRGEGLRQVEKDAALKHISEILASRKAVIGIGSPRASLESNFALRTLVGPDNFYSGMSGHEHKLTSLVIDILRSGPARTPSLHEVEMADAVLVLGEDVTNTAPMLALALRQSVWNKPKEMAAGVHIPAWDDNAVRNFAQRETGPLYVAALAGTKLDTIASRVYHAAPDDIARLGFAIAHELNPRAPAVPYPSQEVVILAGEIARSLKEAKRPLVVSGTSLGSSAVIQAAANVAGALCEIGKPAGLCYIAAECNSIGSGLMSGKSLDEAFNAIPEGEIDTVIILENDLYRRADHKMIDAFLNNARNVIVIDHIFGPTALKADIVLPAGTFAESNGTLVNNEGRAQRFYQAFVPKDHIQESWKWIHAIIAAGGKVAAHWQSLDDITSDMISAIPFLSPVKDIAPSGDFTVKGLKIPRQPHRYSGRTAMLANENVHEPEPPEDHDSPLAFSMEGYEGQPPAPFISRFWWPGWNSVQALNKFQQEVGGPLRGGDPGKRLMEPGRTDHASFFNEVPAAFTPGDHEWLLAPLYQIFGSDELSILSPGVAERISCPYLAMNPGDALRINVQNNDDVEVLVRDTKYVFKVKVDPTVPVGIAGFSSGTALSTSFGSKLLSRIIKAP
jgi:NADH-quinone oxidoreductase subunit G